MKKWNRPSKLSVKYGEVRRFVQSGMVEKPSNMIELGWNKGLEHVREFLTAEGLTNRMYKVEKYIRGQMYFMDEDPADEFDLGFQHALVEVYEILDR